MKNETIKRYLKSLPGIYSAVKVARRPRKEFDRWRDYRNFKTSVKKLHSPKRLGTKRDKLLIVSLLGDFIAGAKEEALLAKALQIKGLEPFLLTGRGAWVNRYYRLLGINRFVYFEDFQGWAREKIRLQEVEQRLAAIQSFRDLMQYEYHGVKIGKYICSSLTRETYAGSVDCQEPETRKRIREYLLRTMVNVLAADEIYHAYQPHTLLFLERGYTPYGEFFDLSLKNRLNTIQWCGCHSDSALTLKRYNSDNADQHPASLSSKTWESLKKMEWNRLHEEAVRKELRQNYTSGNWFSEVGTQFNTEIMGKEKIQRILDLDPGKKTAVVFSHLFWDATYFWGEDLFRDYREWFVETIGAACANDKVNWIIKMHPANTVKLSRNGYRGELAEKQAIREQIGQLPHHIKLLEPDTRINTYSLFNLMDYCLTVRGTIGIEASFFGIPVFTAGTGRYDHHGFTIDSGSKEEYLEKLVRIHAYHRLSKGQTGLAQRFAYGTFILRPFELKSILISYEKDEKATLQVEYLVRSGEDLLHAEDLKAFGEWAVDSTDEDYLDKEKLRELQRSVLRH